MTGAEHIFQRVIRLDILLPVGNEQADGRTKGLPLKNPGEDLDPILLWPGARQVALAWPSPIELLLDGLAIEIQSGGDPINDHPHGLSMALAKGDDPESFTKTV